MALAQLVECFHHSYVIITLLLIVIYKLLFRETRNVPPGPRGVPLFGYLPFLGQNAHVKCMNLAKKYGSVFSVKLGPNNCVM